jgi:hypothetical protein
MDRRNAKVVVQAHLMPRQHYAVLCLPAINTHFSLVFFLISPTFHTKNFLLLFCLHIIHNEKTITGVVVSLNLCLSVRRASVNNSCVWPKFVSSNANEVITV